MGFCHTRAGVEVTEWIMEEIEERDLGGEVFVTNTGCFGIRERGSIVVVYLESIWYGPVTPEDVEEIMDEHIQGGNIVERLVLP
jgi:(2Fe-2S) ferredoxin